MSKCRWWNRWWHRRQREIDVDCLLPAIRVRAQMASLYEPFTQDWAGDVMAHAAEAFALHKAMPGQEHWRCECSAEVRP